jgi:hypothetical protein
MAAAAVLVVVSALGCERSTNGLEPAVADNDPIVFDDDFGNGVIYQPFLGTKVEAVIVDKTEKAVGQASLKVTVPRPGDASGAYSGGAVTVELVRDLSGYDAVTFWATASKPITLDVAGFGNDNTGTSKYTAERSGIPLTTGWEKFVVPIPLPSKETLEKGLFYFAEGHEGDEEADVWFDEIKFERLNTITNPRPAMASKILGSFVGATIEAENTRTTFNVDGADLTVSHMPGYFTFESSNEDVIKIQNDVIRVVGVGSATVTARLDTVPATGRISVNASAPPPVPAPAPTVPAADVISLFSNVYPNVPVDTWSADWDRANLTDFQIAGDDVKAYTDMGYAGIDFSSNTIDATDMTHFHVDVWVPNGTTFKVKLVDFGADGEFGGGDDREQELTFNPGTTPAVFPGTWSDLDIPLSLYTVLTTRTNIAQLIFSGASTAYVDNIYFHR